MELSPIAAPKFEAGRMSDEGVEINRFINGNLLNQTRFISSEHLSDVLKKVGVLIWRVFALSQRKRYPLYTIWFLAMPPFDSPGEYIVLDRYGQFASTCM